MRSESNTSLEPICRNSFGKKSEVRKEKMNKLKYKMFNHSFLTLEWRKSLKFPILRHWKNKSKKWKLEPRGDAHYYTNHTWPKDQKLMALEGEVYRFNHQLAAAFQPNTARRGKIRNLKLNLPLNRDELWRLSFFK